MSKCKVPGCENFIYEDYYYCFEHFTNTCCYRYCLLIKSKYGDYCKKHRDSNCEFCNKSVWNYSKRCLKCNMRQYMCYECSKKLLSREKLCKDCENL